MKIISIHLDQKVFAKGRDMPYRPHRDICFSDSIYYHSETKMGNSFLDATRSSNRYFDDRCNYFNRSRISSADRLLYLRLKWAD